MLNEDIQPGYAPKELVFMGYKTHNLHHSADAAKAFQDTIAKAYNGEIKNPQLVRDALVHTDQYMKLNDMHLEQGIAPDQKELEAWRHAHNQARMDLERIGEFMHHEDYWHMHGHELEGMEAKFTPETAGSEFADSYTPEGNMVQEELTKTLKSADRVKVARVIADMLGVDNAESMSPDTAVNQGLRKIKNKRMTPEFIGTVKKMVQLAQEVGIKVDANVIPAAVSEAKESPVVDTGSDYNAAKGILRFNDYKKLSKLNKGVVPVDSDTPVSSTGSVFGEEKPAVTVDLDDANPNDEDDAENQTPAATDIAVQKLEKQGAKHTTVGHSLDGAASSDQVRRMKVAYKLGEWVEMQEAVKLGSKVKIHAPGKDYHNQVGYVGEVRHGAYKGAPKTFTVDYGDRKSVQLSKKNVKLHNEEVELAEGQDYTVTVNHFKDGEHTNHEYTVRNAKDRKHAKHIAMQKHEKKIGGLKAGEQFGASNNSVKELTKEEVELDEAKTPAQKNDFKRVMAGAMSRDEYNKKHSLGKYAAKSGKSRIDPTGVYHNLIKTANEEVELEEDQHSADFKVNPDTGRKYRAKHIEFANSRSGGQPLEGDDEKSDVDYKDQPKRNRKNNSMIKTLPEEFDNEHEDLDLSDAELDKMANAVDSEDEILDAYEEDELCIVDQDSGEVVDEVKEEVEQLQEVLSRMERMRAKIRFARTSSKRERKLQVALKTRSSAAKINKRARTLAVKLMKQRLIKKPLAQMTTSEKERAEAIISRRKAVINRLAMKLAPRIRKIENARLSHSKVTK